MQVSSSQTSGTQTRPWQASVQARLTRVVGVDQVEEITYENGGSFSSRTYAVSGHGPGGFTMLDRQQEAALLAELRIELESPIPGTDVVGLQVFVDLLEASQRTSPPSHLFDLARFGSVVDHGRHDILLGQIGLGVDVVGTIRDVGHVLSFEQHPVVLPPGTYRSLSPADRASLARALRANPPADSAWSRILADAESTPPSPR